MSYQKKIGNYFFVKDCCTLGCDAIQCGLVFRESRVSKEWHGVGDNMALGEATAAKRVKKEKPSP
jgi:hypothetical protein